MQAAPSLSVAPSARPQVVVWAVLVAALVVSLAIGSASRSGAAVAAIFVVAAAKAFLVAAHFMHLAIAPRFIRLVVAGALAVVVVLYVGLVPDIALFWSGVEKP